MHRKEGFTFVELLVAVLILGILTSISLPRLMRGATTAKINTCRNNIKIIDSQVERFKILTGNWPNNFNELVQDPNYFPDGSPMCPYGNPYTIQGTRHRVILHSH